MPNLAASVLNCLREHPNGMFAVDVAELTHTSVEGLGSAFESLKENGTAKSLGGLWLTSEQYQGLSEKFLAGLTEAHRAAKNSPYVPAAVVLAKAGITLEPKPLARLLSALEAEGKVVLRKSEVRHADFAPKTSERRQAFLESIVQAIEAEPVASPSPHQLSLQLNAPPQALEEALQEAVVLGRLLHLSPEVFYAPKQIEAICDQLRKAFVGRSFEPRDVRQELDTSRKYADAILAHLESTDQVSRHGAHRSFH